ncbi:MAG: serine/threonine protein kinase, partial [Myxococcota bacterium]
MTEASSSPPPVDRLPVRATFGRFDVLGRLAKGGHAETFLARQPSSGGAPEHVVLKRLLPHVAAERAFVNRFFADARLTMRLDHPSVARVLDLGEEGGSYYVATEWVDGVPLGALIAAAPHLGGLPVAVAVRIASAVAGALHAAHEVVDDEGRPMRVVHRDVSP